MTYDHSSMIYENVPHAEHLNPGVCGHCHHLHLIMLDEDGDPIVQFVASREWYEKLKAYVESLGEYFE